MNGAFWVGSRLSFRLYFPFRYLFIISIELSSCWAYVLAHSAAIVDNMWSNSYLNHPNAQWSAPLFKFQIGTCGYSACNTSQSPRIFTHVEYDCVDCRRPNPESVNCWSHNHMAYGIWHSRIGNRLWDAQMWFSLNVGKRRKSYWKLIIEKMADL